MNIFSMLVYITLGGGIVLAILGAIVVPFIATALGATGELHRDCVIYARITFISMPAFMLQNVFRVSSLQPRNRSSVWV